MPDFCVIPGCVSLVQGDAAVKYVSKLDEFEMFVVRCKFAALPLAVNSSISTQGERDDLPGLTP